MPRRTRFPDAPPAIPAIGYVRVSTIRQAKMGKSLEAQRKVLESYCDMIGLRLVDCIEEPGISAAKAIHLRPGLMRVLELVAEGEIKAVVVLNIDRMFRSIHDAGLVLESFKKRGCAFYAAEQQMDTSTPHGMLMLELLLCFAKMERSMTSERTRLVLRETKAVDRKTLPIDANGAMKHRARSHKLLVGVPPYGYRYDRDAPGKPLVEVPEEQRILRSMKAYKLRHKCGPVLVTKFLNGQGWRTRLGNPWNYKLVSRIMKRDFL
ncbi:MAG TPA: recombinase family protein [bacterium]|nr:recombinase family protein [bacterium]